MFHIFGSPPLTLSQCWGYIRKELQTSMEQSWKLFRKLFRKTFPRFVKSYKNFTKSFSTEFSLPDFPLLVLLLLFSDACFRIKFENFISFFAPLPANSHSKLQRRGWQKLSHLCCFSSVSSLPMLSQLVVVGSVAHCYNFNYNRDDLCIGQLSPSCRSSLSRVSSIRYSYIHIQCVCVVIYSDNFSLTNFSLQLFNVSF